MSGRARWRRHDLATVLAVSIAAAGACSMLAIAEWASIRRVLVALDVLDAVVHAWLAAMGPPTAGAGGVSGGGWR